MAKEHVNKDEVSEEIKKILFSTLLNDKQEMMLDLSQIKELIVSAKLLPYEQWNIILNMKINFLKNSILFKAWKYHMLKL